MAKILIIEDEKAMSDLIAIKFKVEGFEVDQAFGLVEAGAKLTQSGPYNAILTDFLLPDGDLVDFLTAVRKDPKNTGIPILVMTNYVEDINQDQLKTLGVSDILVKYQVVPAQMVERVKVHLQGAQAVPTPVGPVPGIN